MFRWTLTYQGNSTVVNNDPVGWESCAVQYIRSAKYFGLFKEFSTDLGFFCGGDGGDVLKTAFETESFEADVEVLVEFQCADGEPWEVIINGRASMDSYRIERLNEADVAYVKIENNDIGYKLMSRDSVPIDIKSLTGLDGQALTNYTYANNIITLSRKLTIKSILEEDVGGSYNNILGTVDSSMVEGLFSAGMYMPKVNTVQSDLQNIYETDNQYLVQPLTLSPPFASFTLNYGELFAPIFEITETDVQKWPSSLTVTFSVSGSVNCGNFAGGAGYTTAVGNFFFEIFIGQTLYSAQFTPAYSQLIVGSNSNPIAASFSFSGTLNIPAIEEGNKIWAAITLRSFFTPVIPGTTLFQNNITYTINTWDFEFNSDNEFPASEIETCLIHEAFSRVTESLSGQNTAFYSSLLGRKNSQPYAYSSNGCHSFIAVTNGLSVRGKTVPITTSFEEMYDSIEAIGNVGVGLEPEPNGLSYSVIRLEEKSYFFDGNSLLITLTGITNVEQSIWEDEIFNEVEVGYNTWQPFAVTGLDEPLTVQTYTNVIKNIKSKFNAICTAIMSMNLIEIIRRYSTDQTITQDLQQDELPVWVALNRSVDASGNPNNLTTPEKNENFSSISNLTQPATALNLRYSPKRNLARHLNRLAASLLKVSTAFRYASGEGNQAMTSTMIADGCAGDYSGRLLTEDADIRWDDQYVRNNVPLFEPILYDFTHPLSYTEYKTIKANTKGYIRGVCADGTVIEGFVKQIDYTIEKGIADITLIKKYEN